MNTSFGPLKSGVYVNDMSQIAAHDMPRASDLSSDGKLVITSMCTTPTPQDICTMIVE